MSFQCDYVLGLHIDIVHMVTDDDLPDNIYGGLLQAALWLARHVRGPRAQIQLDSTRTGRYNRPRDPRHAQRQRTVRVDGGSRDSAIASAEPGRRKALQASQEHTRRGAQGAGQQEGEGTGIAQALVRMLGRARARTSIILHPCALFVAQRPRGALVHLESCVHLCAGSGGGEGGLNLARMCARPGTLW